MMWDHCIIVFVAFLTGLFFGGAIVTWYWEDFTKMRKNKPGRKPRTMKFVLDSEAIYTIYFNKYETIPSINEFCKAVGITYSQFHKGVESGFTSLETAWKIAEYLGVMIEDVVIATDIDQEEEKL